MNTNPEFEQKIAKATKMGMRRAGDSTPYLENETGRFGCVASGWGATGAAFVFWDLSHFFSFWPGRFLQKITKGTKDGGRGALGTARPTSKGCGTEQNETGLKIDVRFVRKTR